MKISREWLLEFIDFSDMSFDDVCDLITTRIAEIEEVYTVGAPCKSAIIVKVKKVEPHPKKDSLTIVEVTDGNSNYQVVCSARNVREGMITAYVPVGGVVRKALMLAEEENLIPVVKAEVQGIQSEGVLVSESELGMGPSHFGILDIQNESIVIGSSVSALGYQSDQIIDIDNKSLTHRPDLWCHFGFARELSAILHRPLKVEFDTLVLDNEIFNLPKLSKYKISIESENDCRRLSFTSISNITKIETPNWLRRRLFSIGAGTKNLLIDLSNYILHEVGQPNHAYDVRTLRGNSITLRRAIEGEPFTGLDGIKRKLTTSDMVMADEVGAVDLAGVIGGSDFSIQDDTVSILLEAANFDPIIVRKTCKEHSVRTDSSSRFEKGLSPVQTILAPIRFIELLRRVGASFELNAYSEVYPNVPADLNVTYDPAYIQDRLGGVPQVDVIHQILTSLKFEISGNLVKVPYFRATRDISIPDDLVEEVGRTIGYEQVPSVAPKIDSSSSKRSKLRKSEHKTRELLSAEGFTEVYCYTFASKERTKTLGYNLDQAIEVQNAVDKNLNIVQLTLVPNMLDVLNLNNKNSESFFAFEIGRSYAVSKESENGYIERRLCSIAGIDSRKNDSIQIGANKIADGALFYGVRKAVERLVYGISNIMPTFESYSVQKNENSICDLKDWMHPYRSARVSIGTTVIGTISEVKPSLLDIKSSRAVIAEVDLEAISGAENTSQFFKSFSRFPKSHFEVSLVVDANLEYGSMEKVFSDAFSGEPCDTEILPFSIYRGEPLKENEKSISLRFTFSLPDGTLSGDKIEALQKTVLDVAVHNQYLLRG